MTFTFQHQDTEWQEICLPLSVLCFGHSDLVGHTAQKQCFTVLIQFSELGTVTPQKASIHKNSKLPESPEIQNFSTLILIPSGLMKGTLGSVSQDENQIAANTFQKLPVNLLKTGITLEENNWD